MLTQILATELFRDVTDNKTSDNNQSFVYKDNVTTTFNNNIMSELLCREEERLKTFENRWPLRFMDMHVLAQTGMYYSGSNDNVKCYFCGVEIGRWEVTDHPVTEHMRWSPNCPLLRRRQTNNIPIDTDSLDRTLPPLSYDVCGANELIDIRPAAFAESAIASPTQSSNYLYPDHPEYAIESARLRSFSEWPRTMKQKPKELAEAGFFYTGIGDRVKCFSCGGGLKDWDETDDPWEQHALWLSNCHYLKLIKGKTFIDTIIAKHKNINNLEFKDDLLSKEQTSNIDIKNLDTEGKNKDEVIIDIMVGNEKSDEKKLNDEKLCKICYANEYNTAFLPCGHVVACAKCASSVTKCPMCRKSFTDVMRVYFS